MTIKILGISAFYHDSAAALIMDGNIIAAAQEERFTRIKGDSAFPLNAIQFCLDSAQIDIHDIDYITFYDKPDLKFYRIIETYLATAPKGISNFLKAIPIWLSDKLDCTNLIRRNLKPIVNEYLEMPTILFTHHHQSHAAAAFFPSPFTKAAVLCIDGVGEWSTASVWLGENNQLIPQWEIRFPHSLGLLYSAFTIYTGFKVNFGEYKLMGLAPYGTPIYKDLILNELINLKSDGTFRLNMKYFNYLGGKRMINHKFEKLFGKKSRSPEGKLTQHEMDIASSIQEVTNEVILRLANTIYKELGCDYLCMGGGVALNCVANGKLLKEGPFKDIWIQPAANDSGNAIGAALATWHQYLDNPRSTGENDNMHGSYLGPSYNDEQIHEFLNTTEAIFSYLPEEELLKTTANLLAEGNVVGWFQGKMEFGPRALGNRSILADPRSTSMQKDMNIKIKFRESFRPFAPAILAEKVSEYFDMDKASPYMLFIASVAEQKKINLLNIENNYKGLDKLYLNRSCIPAVTHVDYSARIQTVHPNTNPLFYKLLQKFYDITNCPLLINTSFNVRGEPIVCSPEDAYRCFMRTQMDFLIMGNYILSKKEQTSTSIEKYSKFELTLD